jgi:mono/diheme cytochrome c family protein
MRLSTKWRRMIVPGLIAAVAAILLALALAWRPEIPKVAPPAPASFPQALIVKGAALARLGDCAVCHTADGGRVFAGARPLATPFGTLFSKNITPDPDTGIGNWSEDAFRRAMKEGVSRSGSHLYPALPYEHFTHVSDDDLSALYAFLMTRRPVRQTAPASRLIFPLGFRPLLAGWKLLFLHEGPTAIEPAKSPEWNRGAYLAEGLGHCGGCHSPRNLAGGEDRGRAYASGVAEGWRAPALDTSNPAARRWTGAALEQYLRTGISPEHSAAGGPMGPVVESLSQAPPADVHAIAVYVASLMGNAGGPLTVQTIDEPERAAKLFPKGKQLFAGACVGCHARGAPMLAQGRPALGLASSLRDDDPTSAVQAALAGIQPPVARRGPMMPSFVNGLNDDQIAQVLGYARARFTDRAPWPNLAPKIAKMRKESAQP